MSRRGEQLNATNIRKETADLKTHETENKHSNEKSMIKNRNGTKLSCFAKGPDSLVCYTVHGKFDEMCGDSEALSFQWVVPQWHGVVCMQKFRHLILWKEFFFSVFYISHGVHYNLLRLFSIHSLPL